MFDYIRNNTRLMGLLMALFIVPGFVLWGVDGYRQFSGKGETVATVGGMSIKQEEWDNAHKREVDAMRSRQPNVDVKLFDTDEARYAVLERLVRDRLLSYAAHKLNLTASNQRLMQELQQNEIIATLRKPDGTLDLDRYRQLLAGQGMTPEIFEAQVRMNLSERMVTEGVNASAFSTAAVAKPALQAFFEKREVQLARFDPADYRAKVQLSDADIQQYYEANAAQFQSPEQADVEFVVFDLASISANIQISDADARAYYDQNKSRYSTQEERRASHILINAPKTATAAERDAAKAKASDLLAQLKKTPASFAELAKKHSQDTASGANGGDLSYFPKGAMVEPFEKAAFALNKGELSDLVESEFGYHIILVTDIRAAQARPFDEVKGQITAELKKQQAQREFAEKAELFGNMVYEQSDSLSPVAERLKLNIQAAKGISRVPAPGLPAALANAKLLEALFSPESIDKRRNTESIEVGVNQLVSARLTGYQAARTLPLDEVKSKVRDVLVAQRAAAMAKADGEKALESWKAGAEAKLQAAQTISRDKPGSLRPQEVSTILRADTSTLPSWKGVDGGPQGFAVIRINRVIERDVPAADVAAQEVKQYEQWWNSAEGIAYLNALKKRFKVEIKVPRPTLKSS